MRIPRKYIEQYSLALTEISGTGRKFLAEGLSRIDFSQDTAIVRDFVLELMQQACGGSAEMAARLAADFYNGLRMRFGLDDGFAAVPVTNRAPEATEGAVRAFMQDAIDGKPEEFVTRCVERLDYETRRAANECIRDNAMRDPAKVRYARVPTGAETCEWCIMLASRGFVYATSDLASHSHANCDCRVVPSWDRSPAVQGYDPDKYYDMYRNPENYPELQEARNARRRELRAERREDGQSSGLLGD